MKVILLSLRPPQKKEYNEREEWLRNHGSV